MSNTSCPTITAGTTDHTVRLCLAAAILMWRLLSPAAGFAQISPEEHKKHHPNQAEGGKPGEEKTEGMMGGGMMGGMDQMMEKMGAPKPKELYPSLMELPDLPLEKRAEIQAKAHERMKSGAALLSEGLADLSRAAPGDDFAAMQEATGKMQEGLAEFESGLAAHRALAEGKAPRNVALQWFKREMNLLPPVDSEPGFRVWGMAPFHTFVMAILAAFTVAMVWMYFFKMRRASALLEELSTAGASSAIDATQPSRVTPSAGPSPTTSATLPASDVSKHGKAEAAECCDQSATVCEDTCATESGSADRPGISKGLLPVLKRTLCRLRVARVYQETADVKTFRLVACHGGSIPFSYLPGQFLTLTLPTGEKPIRRSYTISSSPTQGYYCEITVKREAQGAGSRYLHDAVKEGDTLEVQAPSGRFTFTGKESDSIVLIAGGVGITPMMSITRAMTDMAWDGEIYFIVACRDPEHFIFESELKKLRERHPNLHLFAAMSRIEQDVEGYHRGRLTKELLAEWVPDIASKSIHLCGAPPMMDATKEMLADLGVLSEKMHTENFGSQEKPHVKTAEREKAGGAEPKETAAKVTFETSEKWTGLLPDETVLEASERVDVNIENSCRVGMCGVCVVKLLSGKVDMDVDDGLDPDDRAAGMILACQAKSTGDVVVEA